MDSVDPQAPAASCPVHPDEAVTGTCARCGRFVCSLCVGGVRRSSELCPACVEQTEGELRERGRVQAFRSLSLSFGVRVVLLLALAVLAGRTVPESARLTLTLVAAAACLPLVAAGALLWLSRRLAVAYLALAIEVLVFGALALAARSPAWFATLLLPLGTLLRVLRLRRLAPSGPPALHGN